MMSDFFPTDVFFMKSVVVLLSLTEAAAVPKGVAQPGTLHHCQQSGLSGYIKFHVKVRRIFLKNKIWTNTELILLSHHFWASVDVWWW